jgi:Lipase (class 3)
MNHLSILISTNKSIQFMTNEQSSKSKAIMLFSQLSNINYEYLASVEALVSNFNLIKTILQDATNGLTQEIQKWCNCNWEVVWTGLNVSSSLNYHEKGKFHTDNSLYIVKGFDEATKKNIYVIAIAGTNSLSWFEKIVEDINVCKTKPWDLNRSHGVIAAGSMIGLKTVLGQFEFGSKGNLMDFFKAQPDKSKMEIITCGHSLGGALAPLVALKLKEWSDSNHYKIPISTYPTAAPTSGNATFAKYAADTLGEGNYISLINTNDIVPMAWEQDTLIKIPNIYNNDAAGKCRPSDSVINFIEVLAKATQKINYTRIAKDYEQSFVGTILPPNDASISSEKMRQKQFMAEVMYQHTKVYLTEGFGFDQAVLDAIVALYK